MLSNKLAVFLFALHSSAASMAQMTFTFSGSAPASYSKMVDGAKMVNLPADAPLGAGFITGVMVDGQAVDASQVVPNPTLVPLRDSEIETFVYDGKAYSFRFIAGGYFTVVMFSDVHVDQDTSNDPPTTLTKAEFQTFVNDIINMGQDGGKKFSFSNAPKGYVPTCDLAICLGDMDKDSQDQAYNSGNNSYYEVLKTFDAQGIPFVDMVGNHDMVPDWWTGDNPDYGMTSNGSSNNDKALEIVSMHLTQAQNHGVTDVTRFTDGTSNTQAQPYAFLFNGVRFYVGQTYWFQKPYSGQAINALGKHYISTLKYYKPDGIISALDTYVESHKDEPSIWTQHYPFVYGSDCDRWWLDQNDVGKTVLPTDNSSSAYPGTETKYGTGDAISAAKTRKDALAAIINKTKNPVHFTGHVHSTATNSYAGITDYSIGTPKAHNGCAYIVLCKQGLGFVECKEVNFSY